jgi:hypothetical protein
VKAWRAGKAEANIVFSIIPALNGGAINNHICVMFVNKKMEERAIGTISSF